MYSTIQMLMLEVSVNNGYYNNLGKKMLHLRTHRLPLRPSVPHRENQGAAVDWADLKRSLSHHLSWAGCRTSLGPSFRVLMMDLSKGLVRSPAPWANRHISSKQQPLETAFLSTMYKAKCFVEGTAAHINETNDGQMERTPESNERHTRVRSKVTRQSCMREGVQKRTCCLSIAAAGWYLFQPYSSTPYHRGKAVCTVPSPAIFGKGPSG